ncbi:hypothetical protein B0T17DRAFT_619261 [Bombardia bombarda]|uniref:Uncharacterized protein n=1 Tax=Bombardia bombarda TaxID=252184 RepID=A0AA39WHQ7_9PEZI|nr:hypothetical protein B0T17DRAFT_619261 [Bombardia bombarda]
MYLSLRAVIRQRQHPPEPPVVENTIPFIGAILAMIKHKTKFHATMRDKYRHPIYTLRVFGSTMYVINAASLIAAVQKQYRAISFLPFVVITVYRVAGGSKAINEIMTPDLTANDGFIAGFGKAIYHTLAPGIDLYAMSIEAMRTFRASLDALEAAGSTRVFLFAWVRSGALLVTTDAACGLHNPFRDPAIEKA